MTTSIWLGLLVIGFVAATAWLAIWSRRDTWARPAAVALLLIAIPVVAYAGAETLGRAKPLALEWQLDPGKEYHVLAAKMIQDVGIWLYLDIGEHEPRSLRLPWDNKTAEAIQKALDGAPGGMEGQFLMLYDPSLATEMEAHPLPQQAEPPVKDAPTPGLTYEQPS